VPTSGWNSFSKGDRSIALASTGTRTAIVTGGASGIGRALVEELARAGVRVVVADRHAESAEETANDIRASGGEAIAAALDVRDPGGFADLVRSTVSNAGRLDYVFNNAGIVVVGDTDDFDLDDWNDVIDVNLRGVVHGIAAAYPVMIDQGFGHIVNTASLAGLIPAPLQGSYTATKHAVVGLSRALRIEARRHGVNVSVLCPGAVRTPILRAGRYGRIVSGLDVDRLGELVERVGVVEPSLVARRTLRAVACNRAVIVVPRGAHVVWLLDRLVPSLSESMWRMMLGVARRRLDRP